MRSEETMMKKQFCNIFDLLKNTRKATKKIFVSKNPNIEETGEVNSRNLGSFIASKTNLPALLVQSDEETFHFS